MLKNLPDGAKKYYIFLIVCSIFYASLTLLGPKAPNTYNLSANNLIVIQLSVIIPIIVIWLIAFFGSLLFRSYTESISKSAESPAFRKISKGLMILAIGLVVGVVTGALKQSLYQRGYDMEFNVIRNYLAVGFAVPAFYMIYAGSKHLLGLEHIKPPTNRSRFIMLCLLAIATTVYTVAILQSPFRNNTPDPHFYNSYYMPDWLIVLTLIIPYALSWLLGVLAALNLLSYRLHAKGVIYKSALNNLVKGILAITFFSIFMQILTASLTSFFAIKLTSLLALVYFILLFYGVGYVFVAKGARDLKRIEEV